MDDLRIGGISPVPWKRPGAERSEAHDPLSDFKKILGRSIGEVNGLLQEANQSVQEMAAGKIDIHQAMTALEQANLSFRLMVQVRNKMIGAYEEIMRMQF
ncbi:MAG: flagellar hook-basal body complex protein FliE [Syntrophaceae bacterium]|jgi:flagellar hook-basal body complex protein FliE|nr:flagellar hook-basal body complex protein FliE [Syntrophaceae bacterium]